MSRATAEGRTKGGEGPVLFISDAHLGVPGESPHRAAWLQRLLRDARPRISSLYILGDLFDFWFEYRHTVPKGHFQFLRCLAEIVEDGIPVSYLAGNHDYWVGSFLRTELGVAVHDDPIERTLQGRRVFLAHGDGLGKGDWGYRIIKVVLRSRLCIALYRMVHPDIGIPFAQSVSALSRRHTTAREILVPKLYRDIAAPRFRQGYDAVIMGHVHEPTHIRAGKEPKEEFLIIGDWLANFTYVELEGGRFRLMRWNPDGPDERLAVERAPGG